MNDYLDQVERQLTQLTERGAHQRLRARRLGFAGRGGGGSRPPRQRSEVLAFLAAAAVVAAVVAIVLVNVHTGKPSRTAAPARTGPTPTATAQPPAVTAPYRPPTTTPAPALTVPAQFAPLSFTATSELEWWVLGPARCTLIGGKSPCGAIAHTTDGGRSFVAISAPSAPLSTRGKGYSQLRFADAQNGFAYGPDLFITHDGGATWHQVDVGGTVTDLAISAGEVYATVEPIGGGSGRLTQSPVAHDGWTTVSAAGVVSGGLSVQGSDVFVQSGVGTGIGGNVLVSTDGGHSFTAHPAPSPGLPCQFAAPTPPVVWARCATGTESGVWRSTDLGVHFAPSDPASRPGQPNSAVFAAASADTAVYGYQQLYRTSNAGATWSPVGPAGIAQWAYLGFTDSTHGVGLAYVGSIAPGNERLYYTTDGGQTYHPVTLP